MPQPYYKDKQSGEYLTEDEVLDSVDPDDTLDSFYYVGDYESAEEAANR